MLALHDACLLTATLPAQPAGSRRRESVAPMQQGPGRRGLALMFYNFGCSHRRPVQCQVLFTLPATDEPASRALAT